MDKTAYGVSSAKKLARNIQRSMVVDRAEEDDRKGGNKKASGVTYPQDPYPPPVPSTSTRTSTSGAGGSPGQQSQTPYNSFFPQQNHQIHSSLPGSQGYAPQGQQGNGSQGHLNWQQGQQLYQQPPGQNSPPEGYQQGGMHA